MFPTRLLVTLPLILIIAVAQRSVAGAEVASKPNVVIIFIDDLGYADIEPYGATKQRTPQLNRMAREGMKLTSFYAAPVCSVSRAQLLTGCYGARVSVPGVFFPGQPHGLHPAEKTIAEYLKELGYATACVGKWHLGDQPEFLPTKQGFDHYFGIPYSNDMLKKSADTGQPVVPLMRDNNVAELLTEEQQSRLVERYTDEATTFIKQHRDQPFLLYLPHSAVHTPIWPGDSFRGKSANGRFGDWVEEVDWSVGRVLDTLREQGLDERTLVIFTSDNGPWLVKGKDGGSALPLRGGKGSTWEGGVRVPTIARWPKQIRPGSVCDAVTGTIDLLPTIVSLAGGKVESDRAIDGRNIAPLLLSQTSEPTREAHYYFLNYQLQAVRQGPWKLALMKQSEALGGGLPHDTEINPRLYHLGNEIGERTNVAEQHPEIVAKLQSLANKMNAEIGGQSPIARRPAGEVAHPTTLYPIITDAAKAKAADLSALKTGDQVDSAKTPRIDQRAFTVAFDVEADQPDAVLVAQGGASAGFAVFLRKGRLVFAARYGGGDDVKEIEANEPLGNAKRVVASVSKDRKLSLSQDGKLVAQGTLPQFIPRQPAEKLCIGHDAQIPVTAYPAIAKFNGKLSGLSITTQ